VSEAARSLLDGHIELSARLAQRGHFPAIDVLKSVSRTMRTVVDSQHADDAAWVGRAISALRESEDARGLGIAPAGAFALRAVAAENALQAFLRQDAPSEQPGRTLSWLAGLADKLR
jgi:type III secretion protein N (ATPase)